MEKMKWIKKGVSALLALNMVLSSVPLPAFAVTVEDGLCDHHTEHTAECGYVAMVEGVDCTHTHDAACGYVEAVQEVPCGCTETDESGAVLHTEGCSYVAPVAGSDCTHTHDDTCGYVAATPAHECHYECAECANKELSLRTSPQTGVAIPEGDAEDQEIATSAPDGDLLAMTEEVCDCGTDDPAIHATTCAVYVAPENPMCFCVEKCTEDNVNIWCDVCGTEGVERCAGEDSAAAYDNTAATITGVSITVNGTKHTEGTVTIPSDAEFFTLTITGTNLNNYTENNVVYISGLGGIPVGTNWGWIFSDDNTSATNTFLLNESDYSYNAYPIMYSNDGGQTSVDTNIQILYKPDLTEVERAQITGASITVDGTEYTSGNVTITPDSQVTLTVTGTNLQNGTRDNRFADGKEQSYVRKSSGWTISEDGKTATLQASGNQYAGMTPNEQIWYTNDGGINKIYTGIYLKYEPPAQATITGVSITVDGQKYTSQTATATDPAVITPTSEIVFTVTGTNLNYGTAENLVNDGGGNTPITSSQGWSFSEDGGTATLTLLGTQYANIQTAREISYTNTGAPNWSGTGIYLISGYRVTVNSAVSGTVTADKTAAVKGKTVTLTVNPESDNLLETLTVTTGTDTITTTKVGDTTYTFTMPESAVTVNATFAKVPVTGVTLSKETLALDVGETETLTADVQPAGATNNSLSWTSSDNNVATVNDEGVVTGEGAGTATITVTTRGGGFSDTCTVTVHAHSWTYTKDGNTIRASCCDCNDDGGSVKIDVPDSTAYTGSAIEAKVTDNLIPEYTVVYSGEGLVDGKPVEPGEYTATITLGEASVSVTYTITAVLNTVTVTSNHTGTVAVPAKGKAQTITLTAMVDYSGGADANVTANATWTLADTYPGVSIQDNIITLTPKAAAGTIKVKAAYGGQMGEIEIQLTKADVGKLTLLKDITGDDSISVADSSTDAPTFTYSISGEDAYGAEVTPTSVTWSVSGYTGASINENGILTVPVTIPNGTELTITAASGSLSKTKVVTVTAHVHEWAYRLAQNTTNTIEAYCKNTGDNCYNTSGGTLNISASGGPYNGSAYKAELTVSNDWVGDPLTDADISYEYKQNEAASYAVTTYFTKAGTYKASITVDNATAYVEYTVAKKALTITSVTAADRTYERGNKAVTITAVTHDAITGDGVTVTAVGELSGDTAGIYNNKITLTNLTISGEDAENYSLPTVPMEITASVTISPKSLTSEDITASLSDNVIFEGQPTPAVTVKDGETVLPKDTDYTVFQTGSNGEFTLTITGAGNYEGTYGSTLTYLVVTLPDPSTVEPYDEDAIDAYDRYTELNKKYQDAELAQKLEELRKALTDYKITKGNKRSYVKGSYKTLSFAANGPVSKFAYVEVDGKQVDAKYYTVTPDSGTVITLKAGYLETLSAGKHTIQVFYADGKTDTATFRISINNGNPFTGDNSHMILFGGVAMVSLLCMAMMVMFIPRKKGKYAR